MLEDGCALQVAPSGVAACMGTHAPASAPPASALPASTVACVSSPQPASTNPRQTMTRRMAPLRCFMVTQTRGELESAAFPASQRTQRPPFAQVDASGTIADQQKIATSPFVGEQRQQARQRNLPEI